MFLILFSYYHCLSQKEMLRFFAYIHFHVFLFSFPDGMLLVLSAGGKSATGHGRQTTVLHFITTFISHYADSLLN